MEEPAVISPRNAQVPLLRNLGPVSEHPAAGMTCPPVQIIPREWV
jgi:hypothetical protein